MAASYQTGLSSSATNILQILATWLSGQAWTINLSAADGAGWRLHASKGGVYLNFRASELETVWPKTGGGFWDIGDGYGIHFYMGTGWTPGNSWDDQPGAPLRVLDLTVSGCGMHLPQGATAGYHFFDDGNDHVVVVVEKSPGIFGHLGWGPALARLANPEDFPYFFGATSAYLTNAQAADTSVLNSRGFDLTALPPMSPGERTAAQGDPIKEVHCQAFVRVDAASFTDRWIGDSEGEQKEYGWTGRRLRCALNLVNPDGSALHAGEFPNYRYLWDRAGTGFSGNPGERTLQSAYAGALVLPLHLFLETQPEGRWAPIGYPPTVFWSQAVGNGFSALDVVQIGGLDYMLFPGFAVRKAA